MGGIKLENLAIYLGVLVVMLLTTLIATGNLSWWRIIGSFKYNTKYKKLKEYCLKYQDDLGNYLFTKFKINNPQVEGVGQLINTGIFLEALLESLDVLTIEDIAFGQLVKELLDDKNSLNYFGCMNLAVLFDLEGAEGPEWF